MPPTTKVMLSAAKMVIGGEASQMCALFAGALPVLSRGDTRLGQAVGEAPSAAIRTARCTPARGRSLSAFLRGSHTRLMCAPEGGRHAQATSLPPVPERG